MPVAKDEEILRALKAALALFGKGHALSRFDWGKSFLRAEDIRELNELPGQLQAAIHRAEKPSQSLRPKKEEAA